MGVEPTTATLATWAPTRKHGKRGVFGGKLYRLSPQIYTPIYTRHCIGYPECVRLAEPFSEEFGMPRVYEMSWDAPRGRWVKMYRGERYTVACSVLGAPATKEGSYQ